MHLGQHALTSDPLSTVQAEVAWREGTLYPVRVPDFMPPFQTSLSLKSQQKRQNLVKRPHILGQEEY